MITCKNRTTAQAGVQFSPLVFWIGQSRPRINFSYQKKPRSFVLTGAFLFQKEGMGLPFEFIGFSQQFP